MSEFVDAEAAAIEDAGSSSTAGNGSAKGWKNRLSDVGCTLLPRSLPGRFFMFMLLLVFASQLMITIVWTHQTRTTQEKALETVVFNMAMRVSSTIEYFDSLPIRYRHIILDQLRDMGGTRYFVTLNRDFIEIDELPEPGPKRSLLTAFRTLWTPFMPTVISVLLSRHRKPCGCLITTLT